MRKIILASRSKARQKLLRQIGLKFEVSTSRVKEKRSFKKSCSSLVMENALKKAKDVASRYKKGIVISADTVVLVGKKIIGKPKNLKDAFNTLRVISKKPQWVYSGIAVIDIDNKKTYTDYEKTKVCMYRLYDKQIKDYFRRTSPLGKAGSFDIQGRGAMFIDRVEGCYYNVVGLPLARLARILEKINARIF